MQIEIDSDLNYHAEAEGCEPIVFVPDIDFREIEEPNIIEAF